MTRRPKQKGTTLTDGERHLLLTGRPYPDGSKTWPDGSNKFWPFILCSPGGRHLLRDLWVRHRDELLSEWKASGRRGLPWAARQFDKKGGANGGTV